MVDLRQHQPESRQFRIWVAGRLGQDLADDLGGVAEHGERGTVLSGDLVDQSQIYGILDRLRQFGIEVLRFETDVVKDSTQTPMEDS